MKQNIIDEAQAINGTLVTGEVPSKSFDYNDIYISPEALEATRNWNIDIQATNQCQGGDEDDYDCEPISG